MHYSLKLQFMFYGVRMYYLYSAAHFMLSWCTTGILIIVVIVMSSTNKPVLFFPFLLHVLLLQDKRGWYQSWNPSSHTCSTVRL